MAFVFRVNNSKTEENSDPCTLDKCKLKWLQDTSSPDRMAVTPITDSSAAEDVEKEEH